MDQVSKESSQMNRMKNHPFMLNSASITKLNLYMALLKIGEILIKRAIILGCFSSTPIAAPFSYTSIFYDLINVSHPMNLINLWQNCPLCSVKGTECKSSKLKRAGGSSVKLCVKKQRFSGHLQSYRY